MCGGRGKSKRRKLLNRMGRSWTYLGNRSGSRRRGSGGSGHVMGDLEGSADGWWWAGGGVGRGAAEQTGAGAHTGPREGSKPAMDPSVGLAEGRTSPRKSSSGLATDLIPGSREMTPPVIYRPRTKALFTHDFAFALRSFMDEGLRPREVRHPPRVTELGSERPVSPEPNELAQRVLPPTLPCFLRIKTKHNVT